MKPCFVGLFGWPFSAEQDTEEEDPGLCQAHACDQIVCLMGMWITQFLIRDGY